MRALTRLLASLLTLLASTSFAAIPDSIHYQGYLTDSAGSPINSNSVNLSLSLYTVPAGGTPIWTEPHIVSVAQGLFEVELGLLVLFPSGAFDTELFLGVTVESDPEMVPRRALSAAPFARKADDADTLAGVSAASLDQSAHVADTLNPHNVTADQAGAVSGADLVAHTGDVSAHHNRYKDNEAVAAIMSVDGAGSGLDADLLDGLSSAAFVQGGADYGRPGVAADLFEGTQPLSLRYVNEAQGSSITGTMIVDGTISPADIRFPMTYSTTDPDGGLLTLTNTVDGSPGNVPAGLLGQASGDPGASFIFGVAGLAPGLGAGTPLTSVPAGQKYGVMGAVDTGIGTAGFAAGTAGIGVYGDGSGIGVKGVGTNGPTKGYLGVQGQTNFDGELPLDIGGLEIGVLGYSSGGSTGDNYGLYGVSNGVGVYGEGTISAGRFVGDVSVTGEITADQLVYNTPRTHYYSVGDGDFYAAGGDDFSTSFGQGGSYIAVATATAMVAGLHLPDGAQITGFRAIIEDTAPGDLLVWLASRAHAGTVFGTLASVSTSGTPGVVTLIDSTIDGPTVVDNLTYAYHVRAYSDSWPGNVSLKIKGAVVEYTIAEVP